jgi:hypothetical protein
MTGSCWRLLAAFLLIFVAPTFLRGQDAAADRVVAPVLAASPYSPLTVPIRIPPPPSLPPHYMGGRYPVGAYPSAPGGTAFQQLVRSAGIIFSGRVTSVGRADSSARDPASTSVTFRVEHAIRGTSPGENLTIQEWAGLWTSGERYRVGERVLLFLYAPSKLGLTSPVAGTMGRFAMDSEGKVVMSAQHAVALAEDPILGGKTVVSYTGFALAVRRSSEEE